MRPSVDQYFIEIVRTVSSRSTCRRRRVGCILVDSENHIVATGYNGVPAKATHCLEKECPGASFESGSALDTCASIHAEQNAVAQVQREFTTAYISCSPCMSCIKLLLATGCRRIVFEEIYDKAALNYWSRNGGKWFKID